MALGLEGLSWQSVFMAWDKRIVLMAEHLVHVLGGTYVTQGGLNSTAAGLSVKTKDEIAYATYQKYEHHLTTNPHWLQNLNASKTRSADIREKIASLPAYILAKQELARSTIRREGLILELEKAKREQADLQSEEKAAWLLCADVTGGFLNELKQTMKYRDKLKAIRNILLNTPEGEHSVVVQRVQQLQTQSRLS